MGMSEEVADGEGEVVPDIDSVHGAAGGDSPGSDSDPRVAFISYVSEDSERVDELERHLNRAGIAVWRDRGNLKPGQDWKLEIRKAIKNNELAFLACFSDHSARRAKTVQNEELALAAEEFRLRPPGTQWLFPVRFDPVEIPAFDLGAGRDLSTSLQWTDLFGHENVGNLIQLVSTIRDLLGVGEAPDSIDPGPVDPAAHVKAMLQVPDRRIALDDYVSGLAKDAARSLSDVERFPFLIPDGEADNDLYVSQLYFSYEEALRPLMAAMMSGCAFSDAAQTRLWALAVETVAGTVNKKSSDRSHVVLTELRKLGPLLALYAGGIGALARDNYAALHAITQAVARSDRSEITIPLVAAYGPTNVHVDNGTVAASAAAQQADGTYPSAADALAAYRSRQVGKRHTPVSDLLYRWCWTLAEPLFSDETAYEDAFDRFEALCGAVAAAARAQVGNSDLKWNYDYRGWGGCFTWRYRYDGGRDPLALMLGSIDAVGGKWPPLEAGMFSGSTDVAVAALTEFNEFAVALRSRRW